MFLLLLHLLQILPSSSSSSTTTISLRMPNIKVTEHDTYLATAVGPVPDSYIVGYTPRASAVNVHHLLIYGCEEPAQRKPSWQVGDMGGLCGRGIQTILWAWALDAPKFIVPENIAFHIGPTAKINYLLLEIHYKYRFEPGITDDSGVDIITSVIVPPNLAGIYLFAASTTTIHKDVKANADLTCPYEESVSMVPFAFRTHTHKLGRRVSAWRERGGEWTLLGSGDPQRPQMFYLMKGRHYMVQKGDVLHARCEYEGATKTTFIGPTGNDEMCNFYMMYYMESSKFKLLEPCGTERSFYPPESALPQNIEEKLELRMPKVHTTEDNTYLATAYKVDHKLVYITGFIPRANSSVVHHLLLFGCEAPYSEDSSWNAGDMGGVCEDSGFSTIIWAWALDAPQFQLPEGIGFKVGSETSVKYLLLEIHYKYKFEQNVLDSSGVDVMITHNKPDKLAGIYLFAAGSTVIPPNNVVNADMTCTYKEKVTIFPFAYRVHTHVLGSRVSAWRQRDSDWTVLGSGNPRKPQMFYKMKNLNPIKKDDILHARCVFNSTNIHKTTYIGPTGSDEMCNFYMMYYTPYDQFKSLDGCYREANFNPPNQAAVDHSRAFQPIRTGSFIVDQTWTSPFLLQMGQVAGLSHTKDNKDLVVFHRGKNDWSSKQWFGADNVILFKTESISDKAIVYLDASTGQVQYEMGNNHFYLPHGIYLDQQDDIWVTDVGLHQVIKFERGNERPKMILGTAFVPGNDETHFCKPTAVVIDNKGNIYVSDGYCNSRVVKFDKDGLYLASFGTNSTERGIKGGFNLVHDLTIDHKREVIYVADRENGQIHVMDYNGVFLKLFDDPKYGKVYAVEYSPSLDILLSVNISFGGKPSKISVLNPLTGHINKTFPHSNVLNIPHCMTYIDKIGVFIGEISKPFHIWKFKERFSLSPLKPSHYKIKPIVSKLNKTTVITDKKTAYDFFKKLPISFIVVFVVCGCIPILYLMIVIVFRLKNGANDASGKENGFQKLLKDYDDSEEEEEDELLYERYHR